MKTNFHKWVRAFKAGVSTMRRTLKAPGVRSYPAGALNRLTSDWSISGGDADSEIRFDIEALRERSRQLERSDPMMWRALETYEKNVLMPGHGFALQNEARFENGRPDKNANDKIENAWLEWARPANCTVTGEESFYEVCRLSLRSAARDGGFLIRKIIDRNANRFGFTLQTYEIDYLDTNYNETLPNGNKVVMGIEKNRQYKTIAYHLLQDHPGDMMFGGRVYKRIRIPAAEVIHYFVKTRQSQCVGVPWAAPSMLRLHHLSEYEVSEMIAARNGANKGGFFTEGASPYPGEEETTQGELGTQKTGATIAQSEPGQSDILPSGMTFTPYDPTHPTQQFGDFVRESKLGIAAGFNLSYATLIGDLTKSSFSSMRTGLVDERETFVKMQCHMIEHLAVPIFEAWLETAITMGAIDIPMSRFHQVNKPKFRGRRFQWIDPLKDIQAAVLEVKNGFKTRDQIIDASDSDLDLEETFEQLGYEKELAEEEGLNFDEAEAAEAMANEEPETVPTGNGVNGRDSYPGDAEHPVKGYASRRKIIVARG